MTNRRFIIALIAMATAPIALPLTAAAINASGPDHCDLQRDWNFNGETLIVEVCRGKLNMVRSTRIVERF